jgi:putative transposase
VPWRTANVMDQRIRFVVEAERGFHCFSELCRRYGISRPTGYKWLDRYREEGFEGLADRSHRPDSCPHATPPEIRTRILEVRKHRGWGARKIRKVISEEFDPVPCVDTVHQILERAGLVKKRKPRRRRTHPGPPTTPMDRPNAVWTVDFKGEFRTGDGKLCYPLTIQDGCSRFLLDCKGMLRIDQTHTRRRFDRLFRTYGLPDVIKSDNGVPFASTAIARLSRLSVHWIKLGIRPELIEPASPHQNGRHERMHRTLKAETTRPAAKDLRAQQRRFDSFRRVFNEVRPHEAIDLDTPADVYSPSLRTLPSRTKEISYPLHFEVRKISQDTTIRWKNRKVFVSNLLKREFIGLEEVGEGLWSVYFGPVHLGWLDEQDFRIMDVKDKRRRR